MKKLKVLFYAYDFDDEPIGVLYISGTLKSLGVDTDIVLTKYENYIDKTKEFNPDIAAFTVTTGLDGYYLGIAETIKKINQNIITVFGGPHCTFFPDFIENENADFVFRGESEPAISSFIKTLTDSGDYSEINNLIYKKDGKKIINELGNLVSNIDDLPQPDRNLLVKYRFYRESSKKDFITGRGCPFNCSYCFNHAFNKMYRGKGKIIRKHGVDYILTQIRELKKNARVDFIQFVDDIFIIYEDWLREFSEKYAAEFDMPFNCNIRVDYVTEKSISLLKKSGCHSVSMGIESGDEYVRNNILKRNLKDSEIINACRIIKSAGLKLASQNIVGIPGGSLENDFKTMRLNYNCRTDYAWCTLYQPYPGVELTEYAIKIGVFNGDRNNISPTFHNDSILNIPDKKKIINLHKLFGIGSEFGKFEFLIKTLIKFNLTGIYSLARKLWNFYCYKFRIAKKIGWKEIFIKVLSKKYFIN